MMESIVVKTIQNNGEMGNYYSASRKLQQFDNEIMMESNNTNATNSTFLDEPFELRLSKKTSIEDIFIKIEWFISFFSWMALRVIMKNLKIKKLSLLSFKVLYQPISEN